MFYIKYNAIDKKSFTAVVIFLSNYFNQNCTGVESMLELFSKMKVQE